MLKVGDRVRICKKSKWYGSSENNPANKTGIVSDVVDLQFKDQLNVWVDWGTGLMVNSYQEEDLELVTVFSDMEADSANPSSKSLTLPTDSEARKQIPMFSGCIKYFPAAIAGVARISKIGNDKHNPGQDLHHDRSKSLDHADCIIRHLTDVADLIASLEREENTNPEQILTEVSSLAWRALAYSQTLHEKYDGAPLAPGAKPKT